MKIKFNNKGTLVIESEDNTEMVALDHWSKGMKLTTENNSTLVIDYTGHLKTSCAGSSE